MISVIICSADADFLSKVRINIKETIGVPFEILAYDNSNGRQGICEIYNQGVRDAKYNILCFMHEDVEIGSLLWGQNVLTSFEENTRLGLLGIAGSSYKSFSPSGWDSSYKREKINYTNLVQQYKYSGQRSEQELISQNISPLETVATIDGVWFCSRKEILEINTFDQKLLKKFHGYDIDISLSIGKNHDIAVTFDILLTHFSEGNFNKKWVKDMLLLHEKWKSFLPVNKAGFGLLEAKTCEKYAFKSFITTMRKLGISSSSCIGVLNRSGVRRKFGWLLYARLYIKCLSR